MTVTSATNKGRASAPTVVTATSAATGILLLAANKKRITAVLQNLDPTNDVFIGSDTTVTTANGIKLAAGASFVDDNSTGAWRGICTSGNTASVRVLEVS